MLSTAESSARLKPPTKPTSRGVVSRMSPGAASQTMRVKANMSLYISGRGSHGVRS